MLDRIPEAKSGDELDRLCKHTQSRIHVTRKNTSMLATTKLKFFVGGVPMDMSEDEFAELFRDRGARKAWLEKNNYKKGGHRGFGFSIFEDEQAVRDMIGDEKGGFRSLIDCPNYDCRLEIKPAVSKLAMKKSILKSATSLVCQQDMPTTQQPERSTLKLKAEMACTCGKDCGSKPLCCSMHTINTKQCPPNAPAPRPVPSKAILAVASATPGPFKDGSHELQPSPAPTQNHATHTLAAFLLGMAADKTRSKLLLGMTAESKQDLLDLLNEALVDHYR